MFDSNFWWKIIPINDKNIHIFPLNSSNNYLFIIFYVLRVNSLVPSERFLHWIRASYIEEYIDQHVVNNIKTNKSLLIRQAKSFFNICHKRKLDQSWSSQSATKRKHDQSTSPSPRQFDTQAILIPNEILTLTHHELCYLHVEDLIVIPEKTSVIILIARGTSLFDLFEKDLRPVHNLLPDQKASSYIYMHNIVLILRKKHFSETYLTEQ